VQYRRSNFDDQDDHDNSRNNYQQQHHRENDRDRDNGSEKRDRDRDRGRDRDRDREARELESVAAKQSKKFSNNISERLRAGCYSKVSRWEKKSLDRYSPTSLPLALSVLSYLLSSISSLSCSVSNFFGFDPLNPLSYLLFYPCPPDFIYRSANALWRHAVPGAQHNIRL
jgi:hypothetical protein